MSAELLRMRLTARREGTARELDTGLNRLRRDLDQALDAMAKGEPLDVSMIPNAGILTHLISRYNDTLEALVYLDEA